jgi:hypothetical protein
LHSYCFLAGWSGSGAHTNLVQARQFALPVLF